MWTLEQDAQQWDASGVADGLLVLGAFTAAPQRQQCAPGHFNVFFFLQVGQVGDLLQNLDLRTRDIVVERRVLSFLTNSFDFILKIPEDDLRVLWRM